MRRFLMPALGAMTFVTLAYWGQAFIQSDFKLRLLVWSLLLYVLLSLLEATIRVRTFAHLRSLDPADVRELEARTPAFREFVAERPRDRERRDWRWAITWTTGAVLSVLAPITLLPWVRSAHFSPDTPITGLDLVALVLSVGGYVLLHRRALVFYRCPRCYLQTAPLPETTTRRSCAACGTVWRVQP